MKLVCAGVFALGLGLAGARAAAADAAEPAPSVAPGIVELPKFEVSDTRLLPLPESWLYAEVPGYEVLSGISARQTRRFIEDFLLLQHVIDLLMPGLSRGKVPVPTALILTGRGPGFTQFLPPDERRNEFSINTVFYENAERGAIVVDFALSEIQLDGDVVEESDPYRGFYLNYFRSLIRHRAGRSTPAWLEEGLVQILASTEFNRKWVVFAQIGDGFGGMKSGDFRARLLQHGLIPLREFLKDEREPDAYWRAQAYGFVHMCLYGNNRRFQAGFIKFVTRIGSEPVTEELFRECFGRTFAQMGIELRSYIEFTHHTYMQFKAKKGQELPAPPAVNIVEAPDAVVGRLKGEVLRLAGNGERARNELIAPYIRGSRDPRLLAALGLDERQAGQDERARKFLEAAVAAKVDRATAYLELARLRSSEVTARPEGPDGRLSAKQAQFVLEPLHQARRQPPPMVGVYSLLAETWARSETPLQRDDIAILVEGVRLFPRKPALVMQAAQLAADVHPEEAIKLARHGVKILGHAEGHERFAALLAELERKHPPAPVPSVSADGTPATPAPQAASAGVAPK